jgi:hypothetical protein
METLQTMAKKPRVRPSLSFAPAQLAQLTTQRSDVAFLAGDGRLQLVDAILVLLEIALVAFAFGLAVVVFLLQIAQGFLFLLELGVQDHARIGQFRFRARALSGKLAEGASDANAKLPPLVVRVEPDSMLRMVVPPIVLSYDARSRALLRYEGLSNIPNPATGKVFDRVRIDYGQIAPDGAKSTNIE